MVRKSTFIISLLIIFFIRAKSQEFELSDNSLVWEVSSKGLPKSSFLVLTTSNTCETKVSLLKKISGIMDGINVYYTESNVNDPKNGPTLQAFVKADQKEKPLDKLLSPKSYEIVKNKLAALKIDEKVTNQYKPFMIYSILSRFIVPGCNHVNQTEETFRTYAAERKYQVKELFGLQEALDFVAAYGNDYYVAGIEEIVQNEDQLKKDFVIKAEYYGEENIKGIQQLYKINKFFSSRYTNITFENKRIKMLADKIAAAIATGSVIMTIDITNVMNPGTSVFSELKNRGYVLKPVN